MEARVARLETHVEYIKRDVSDLKADVRELRTDMATVKERVNHLPTKELMISALLGTIAALSAIMLLADQIKAALHLVP